MNANDMIGISFIIPWIVAITLLWYYGVLKPIYKEHGIRREFIGSTSFLMMGLFPFIIVLIYLIWW